MLELTFNFAANLTTQDISQIRFLSMFVVLIAGIAAGYLGANHFGLSENLAKKIMNTVLVVFGCPIALLIIWKMRLSRELFYLPVIGAALTLVVTVFSGIIFSLHKLNRRSWLTLVLAGGLSNMGYTGGSFICYTLFGVTGLALAQIYIAFWPVIVYLIFFPILKMFQLHSQGHHTRYHLHRLVDYRMLAVPVIIIAVALNLCKIKRPDWIVTFHIVDVLIYTAAALAFFAIGLRITFNRIRNYPRLYFSLNAVKFLLAPMVAYLLIRLLTLAGCDLPSLAKNVIMVQAVAPCAVSMVTIANVFDLDSELGSAVWVVNTATFIVIVAPVLFFVF